MSGTVEIKTMVPNGKNVPIEHDNTNDQSITMTKHGYVVAKLYDSNGANTQWNVMSHNLGWSYQAWNQTGDSYLTTPTKAGQGFRIWKNRGTIQELYFVNGSTYNIFRGRKMCIKYI